MAAEGDSVMNRKPIFDAVRQMLGRGFTQAEVDALDAACEMAEGSLAGSLGARTVAQTARDGRKLGDAGFALIQSFEGCEKDLHDGQFESYPDPGSTDGIPWTIGWGSTGADVRKGTIWTRQQCDDRFRQDMQRYADAVSRAIGNAPTNQNQFDALVSFHYNTGAIATATLTKKHKAGDYEGAEAEFARWNKNAGKVMKGLVRRRTAEAALYAKT
jgi:GH24 family phage-related lysozyme (muramidase)